MSSPTEPATPEFVDVVDTTGNAIGTIARAEAHETGAMHCIAAVFAFNEDGTLIVQVRTDGTGLLDHSVGGHVASGEPHHLAARREAQEELNIDAPLEYVTSVCADESDLVRHRFYLYTCNWGRPGSSARPRKSRS